MMGVFPIADFGRDAAQVDEKKLEWDVPKQIYHFEE
jgi:hypothetical protein